MLLLSFLLLSCHLLSPLLTCSACTSSTAQTSIHWVGRGEDRVEETGRAELEKVGEELGLVIQQVRQTWPELHLT